MKRIGFCWWLRVSLVLSLVASRALAADLLVESKTVRPGQTFTVTVSVENAQEIGFLLFELAYPSSVLQLVRWTARDFLTAIPQGSNASPSLHESFWDAFRQDGYERLRLAWVQARGYTGSAKILEATFQLATNTVAQPIRLSLGSLQAVVANASLTELPVTGQDGVLTVLLEPGPEVSVVFTGIEFLNTGAMSVSLRGQPGQSYVIEYSEDLKAWNMQNTIVVAADGKAAFTDSAPASAPMRFYRLRSAAR